MWPVKPVTTWISACQLILVTCTERYPHGPSQDRAILSVVKLERRIPVPIFTWTTFITITITTTIEQTTLRTTPPTSPGSIPPPFVVTVPAPTRHSTSSRVQLPTLPLSTRTSSTSDITSTTLRTNAFALSTLTTSPPPTSTLAADTLSTSSLSMLALPKTLSLTTSPISPTVLSTTSGPQISAVDVSTQKITSASASAKVTPTPVLTSSHGTTQLPDTIGVTPGSTSSAENGTATALPPWVVKPDGPLYGTQVAAIVAGVVTFTALIILLGILLWYQVTRRRRRTAQRRQQLEITSAAPVSLGVGSFYSNDTSGGTGNTEASLRGGEIRIVIQSPASTQTWNSGLWPAPPGYTERFTFYSGRSTTTDDETTTATDRGQWSLNTDSGSLRPPPPPRVLAPGPSLYPEPGEKNSPPYRP